MKTIEYIELAKQTANLPSDYALSKRIGVTPQAVSSWRSKSRPRYPESLHACKLAELCKIDPLQVLADIEMDKAEHYSKHDDVTAWQEFLRRATGVAAAVVLGTALSSPTPSNASQFNNNAQEYTLCGMYCWIHGIGMCILRAICRSTS